jgi:uncharacterized membrane protein YgcG
MRWSGFFLRKTQAWLGFSFVLCSVLGSGASAFAADRSYTYDRIDFRFEVRRDTTIRVEETETYRFQGEYHQGNRNIPLRGVDMIDAVSVVDADTGQALVYSPIRLNKLDPKNHGYYTTYREQGGLVIEWYYDARDTTRTWILRYTMHGAVRFLDEKDEFYWNLFTDYAVPVKEVGVSVILPQHYASVEVPAVWYTDPTTAAGAITHPDGRTVLLSGQNFPAFGQATIAVGWPRGALDRSLYWKGVIGRSIWVILAAIAILVSIVSVSMRHFLTERWQTGRGVIIPEYEPPRALPPAMAEVIIKETVSERAWSATIVDLAVRGFVKIEEIPATRMERIGQGIIMVVFLVAVVLFLKGSGMPWQLGIVVFGIWFLRSGMRWFMNPGQGFVWVPKNYRIVRFPEVLGEKLEEYERQFLDILFPDGRMEFSTKDIRKSSRQTERQRMHAALLKLQVTLLEETAIDTSAYAVGFKAWRFAKIGLIVGAGAVLVLSMTLGQASPLVIIPLLLASYFVTWAILFFRYNPRLNRQGQIFREEWLGFKLYLETAEKYRLQNLTPETFERYLPYAIIFGAEKKWGRAFSGIAIEPPRWYGGTSGMSGAMGAGFSAASFTSSFGASFSSAFSSAGGGASSGGGSAGGGGGGGGGGAS